MLIRMEKHIVRIWVALTTLMRTSVGMHEHYSTVRLDEKRAAVASALRLLPGGGESADNGADAGTPANDTAEADAAKAAK